MSDDFYNFFDLNILSKMKFDGMSSEETNDNFQFLRSERFLNEKWAKQPNYLNGASYRVPPYGGNEPLKKILDVFDNHFLKIVCRGLGVLDVPPNTSEEFWQLETSFRRMTST